MDHAELRALAIEHIENNPLDYQDFIADITIEEYIERHSRIGEEADGPIIRALTQVLHINIIVHRIDGIETEIAPEQQDLGIRLVYTGTHYLAIDTSNNQATLALTEMAFRLLLIEGDKTNDSFFINNYRSEVDHHPYYPLYKEDSNLTYIDDNDLYTKESKTYKFLENDSTCNCFIVIINAVCGACSGFFSS